MPDTIVPETRRPQIIIQDELVIPDWVTDFSSFRRWRLEEENLTKGEIAFLGSKIWWT